MISFDQLAPVLTSITISLCYKFVTEIVLYVINIIVCCVTAYYAALHSCQTYCEINDRYFSRINDCVVIIGVYRCKSNWIICGKNGNLISISHLIFINKKHFMRLTMLKNLYYLDFLQLSITAAIENTTYIKTAVCSILLSVNNVESSHASIFCTYRENECINNNWIEFLSAVSYITND